MVMNPDLPAAVLTPACGVEAAGEDSKPKNRDIKYAKNSHESFRNQQS